MRLPRYFIKTRGFLLLSCLPKTKRFQLYLLFALGAVSWMHFFEHSSEPITLLAATTVALINLWAWLKAAAHMPTALGLEDGCILKPHSVAPYDGVVKKALKEVLRMHPIALEGKIGVVTLAGGQLTRLNSQEPKACLPISPGLGRSLLQLHACYLKGAAMSGAKATPWAIMTSTHTHGPCYAHAKEANYFGLDAKDVDFFCQDDLELVDEKRGGVRNAQGEILKGPDGNVDVLHHLMHSGIWDKWRQAGVEVVVIIPVDNPLAYPFEIDLIDPIITEAYGVSAAVVQRQGAEEKVGVWAFQEQKPCVVEYTGSDPILTQSEKLKDQLLFPWANTGVVALSKACVEALIHIPLESLPCYLAMKEYRMRGSELWVYQRERLFFDLFSFLNEKWPVTLVEYSRSSFFSPLRTVQDITNVQKDLILRDIARLEDLGSHKWTGGPIELGPLAWSSKHQSVFSASFTDAVLWIDASSSL